jgi:hypothetical protein
MKRFLLFLAVPLLLSLSACVHADDTPVAGIGGTYWPLESGSQVRMEREFLNIRFSPRLVRTVVQFEFRNEGPAQVVTMGFPETVIYDEGHSTYRRFRVNVDGHSMPVKPSSWQEIEEQTTWIRWWIHRARFAAGQRRIVRVSYQEKPGFDDQFGYMYSYTFGTGRAWKGTIGSAAIVIHFEDFPRDATIYPDFIDGSEGAIRSENRFAWLFEDWEPKKDLRLDINAYPGISDLQVNGNDYSAIPGSGKLCLLKQGKIVGNVETLQDLDDFIIWSHSKREAQLTHKNKTIVLRVGSPKAQILPEGRTIELPFAPYIRQSKLRVPIRAVAEALGMIVDVERDYLGNYKVNVHDPQKEPPPNGKKSQ